MFDLLLRKYQLNYLCILEGMGFELIEVHRGEPNFWIENEL